MAKTGTWGNLAPLVRPERKEQLGQQAQRDRKALQALQFQEQLIL